MSASSLKITPFRAISNTLVHIFVVYLCYVIQSMYKCYRFCQVHGSKGMLTSENQAPDGIVKHTQAGITSSAYKFSFGERYGESYIASLRHFLNVMQGKN